MAEMIVRQRPVIIGKVQKENIGNGIREMREDEGGRALDTVLMEHGPRIFVQETKETSRLSSVSLNPDTVPRYI
jgi:hypothetical protein